MSVRTISTRIALDGEAEFRREMSSVNGQLKNLKTELQLASSEFRNNANSMEALTAKDKILRDQLAQQKTKVDALAQALADAKEVYGENSSVADKYQQQLNSAKVALNKMSDAVDENAKYLKEAEKSADGSATSIDQFGKATKIAGEQAMTFGQMVKANLTADAIVAGLKLLADTGKKVVDAFSGSVTAAAEAGDAIDKGSQKLRISTDEYQELAFAAERCGTSMETLSTANKTLQGTDFSGNLKDAIVYVAGIADENERAAAATELFGKKAGQEMLPLLNSGADGVKALCQEVHDLGGVMSAEAVAAAATYEDSLTNLKLSFSGLKNNLAGDFLPAITTIMDGMTMVMTGNVDEGMAAIEQGIKDFGDQIQELGPLAEDALNLIVKVITDNLPEVFACASNVIIALIDGLCQEMPELIPTVVDVVLTIVDTLTNNVDKLAVAAVNLMVGLAVGIIKATPKVIEKIPEIVKSIYTALTSPETIQALKDAGKELIRGLWEGISNMGAWIGQKIKGFGQGIVDELKSFFGIHSPSTLMRDEIGRNLGEGVVEGFADGIDRAAMEDAIPTDISVPMRINTDISGVRSVQPRSPGTMLASAVNAIGAMSWNQPVQPMTIVIKTRDGIEIARAFVPDIRTAMRENPEATDD